MGPVRLRALLGRWPPVEAWAAVRSGRAPRRPRGARTARCRRRRRSRNGGGRRLGIDPTTVAPAPGPHAAGITVLLHGRPPYPSCSSTTPTPRWCCSPGVISARSMAGAWPSWARVTPPRWVGRSHSNWPPGWPRPACAWCLASRSASTAPRTVARWSADAAPPIGVVGSGLDIVYPAESARLWDEVTARGVLLSEAPLGARARAVALPRPQSHHRRARRGGRRGRVAAAGRVDEHRRRSPRPRPPGARGAGLGSQPRRARALTSSSPRGRLRYEMSATSSCALGFARPGALDIRHRSPRRDRSGRPPGGRGAVAVERVDLDALIRATGLPLAAVALSVTRLELKGVVARRAGWIEYVGGAR